MIDIEQFVRVRAAIEEGKVLSDVLRSEGLSRPVWRAAERRWASILISEVVRGEHTHTVVFRRSLGDVMDPAPLSEPPARNEAHPISVAAKSSLPPVIPSPVVDPPRMPQSLDAPPPEHTVGFSDRPPPAEVVPFAGHVASLAPIASEVAAEAVDLIGATGTVSALRMEELADGLPFTEATGGGDLDGTAILSSLDLGDQPATPFVEGRATVPAAVGHLVEREGNAMVGETGSVAALAETELTLQQYASLVVDLERAGAAREPVLHRYSVADESAWASMEASWTKRFCDEPSVYGQFRAAYDAYSAWLKGAR